MAKRGEKKLVINWTEVFLLLIILLNIVDFFEIIGSELDYVKKIISWVLLGGLLYKASPSHIIFGKKDGDVDTLMIFAFFCMVLKNLISYASTAITDATVLKPFYAHLISFHTAYEMWAFMCGIILLVGLSIYAGLKIPFSKRSIMGVLHEEGKPSKQTAALRSTITFVVLLSFFLLVFNLMMEWLAIAVDATLLMAALFFYLFFLIRHKLTMHKYIKKVGDIGSEFYISFINHFRYKETFFLGLAGLLVLHTLTDVGNFLIPYITGIGDQLYFSQLGAHHQTAWAVLKSDLNILSFLGQKISVIAVFILNIVGFLVLFISPAVMWFQLYKKKQPRLPRWVVVLFFTSLPAIIMQPLFGIKSLGTMNLVGVDVITQSLLTSFNDSFFTVLFCVGMLAVALKLAQKKRKMMVLTKIWVASTCIFLGKYAWHYFIDIAAYYLDGIIGSVLAQQGILALLFILFLVITTAFYIGSFVIFLYELVHRPMHNSK